MIDYIAPFLTFAAWVLQLFAFVGDLANRPFIDGIYYVKLDITGNVPSFIGVLENDVGIPDFVTFGLFGFCQGYYSSGIYYCSPPQLGYKFQPQGTVEQVFANLTPGLFTGFITSVQAGVFIPALILTFITFCIGLFGFRYRGANIGASVVCFFAFCLTLATFVIEIVAYTTVGGSLTLITLFTVRASLGPAVWMTLGAVIALFIAMVMYFMSCCCGVGRKDGPTIRRRRLQQDPQYV